VRITPDGARFRVWAPRAFTVSLLIEKEASEHPLLRAANGYFEAFLPGIAVGTRYRYRVDGSGPYPDPCSRFQPDGPHGASQLVDTSRFAWTDQSWQGTSMAGQVLYELHVGAFTPEGTFDAAVSKLTLLRDLGITTIELMPVAEFPGRFNWGYDGVQLFAPYHGYGDAQGLMRFVDAAHRLELAVILDVVYNHLGPDGNYLMKYSESYFTTRYENEWGAAINFDGAESAGVRAFFLENVRYWIEDFHLDGLRLDATQSIHDSGTTHILQEIVTKAHAAAAGRSILITAENEPQTARHLLPIPQGGFGFDAMWNDDFHHAARVAATGSHEGYFTDYRGTAQEFVATAKRGFLFQGQYYGWQKQPRGGRVTSQPASAFVVFTQNHDQVANTFYGQRLHQITSAGRERALTALLLLGPQTPLLFMGQEFSSDAPFPFFADHNPDLRAKVHAGRREFLSQFPSYATPAAQAAILDPAALDTFMAAKLNWQQRAAKASVLGLYRDLLRLRREDAVIKAQDRHALDGAVLGEHCLILRWFATEAGAERLLLVNLAADLELRPLAEPLLAPVEGRSWQVLWSSDDPAYGGGGRRSVYTDGQWFAPAEQATLLGTL
jgi:maltooligosyltrehalose trehalohydrolase